MSPDPRIPVFFYGSFMNAEVLAASGVVPQRFDVARLHGFDIRIDPLANLVRSDRHCVYGLLVEATHAELDRLYSQSWVSAYRPEAVLVELEGGRLLPALCYVKPEVEPAAAAADYVDRIIEPARLYGFPGWYVERLRGFRPDGAKVGTPR